MAVALNRSRPFIRVLAFVIVVTAPGSAAAQRNLEYEVKGAFLYNFLSFIEWPPAALARPDAPLRICLVGDPFGHSLDALVRDERISQHPIEVLRLRDDRVAASCQLIFVSELEELRLPTLVRTTAGQSTLIVGESASTLESCAAIALVVDGERVRFDVNLAALEARGLKASSKLLRVARETSPRFRACR